MFARSTVTTPHDPPPKILVAGADTPGVIAPPPLIYVGALGIGFGLDALIGGATLPPAVARPVGAALIVAGGGLLGRSRVPLTAPEHPLTRTRLRRRSSPMARTG